MIQVFCKRAQLDIEWKMTADSLIELTIPGCSLSPRCLKMYMTPPHAKAATMANGVGEGGIGLGLASGEVRDGKGCARGWSGCEGGTADVEYSLGMNDRITRDMT